MAGLKEAQGPLDRLTLGTPEKIDAEGNDVPLKMDMQALKK